MLEPFEPHLPEYLPEPAPSSAPRNTAPDTADAAAHLQLTGLRAGMDALDVGCGDGAVTRVMSTIVGPGRVTGVDSNRTRVAEARAQATTRGIEIEYLEGVAIRLPLAAVSFDYTWARLVVAAQPQPARALAELLRVTRPGGRVVVGEVDGLLAQLSGWCAQAGLCELTVHTVPCADGTLVLVCGIVPAAGQLEATGLSGTD